MKTFSVLILGLVALLALTGMAAAAVLPNATPETQGISTTTYIECVGFVSSSEQYSSQLSNQALDGAPLATGEVYSASTYSGYLNAVKGETILVKTVDLNNQNQAGTGKNVAIAQMVESEGGRIVVDEDASIFNAGQATSGTTQFLCPFTSASTAIVPPFNEAVVMGSHIDAGTVSSASETGIVSVAKTGDVPSTINMDIAASGSGIISTYMGVNAQDARGTGQTLIAPEKTTKIPGKTVTNVVTPGTTTTETVEGHWSCFKWIPEKTTTVTTKDVTETVTTKDQKVTTPAVYSAVTPSSTIKYTERSSAMGDFTFVKNMRYTSQVG
jgi:hypothetical protein